MKLGQFLTVLALGLASSTMGLGQDSPPRRDPSPHKVQFVAVEDGVPKIGVRTISHSCQMRQTCSGN
jgi:hypothetical protein